ncbi:hypothetical protein CEXT_330871 [Caerostris extrusa]|uniref:Uncharacterized protein n=1 Tax=Caerostris extrusa TaxID=172846 RepID=A0AAV4MP48_CAEEX|nr:hypothetical protein CEXT_330871 [Caerostris extrusa]
MCKAITYTWSRYKHFGSKQRDSFIKEITEVLLKIYVDTPQSPLACLFDIAECAEMLLNYGANLSNI